MSTYNVDNEMEIPVLGISQGVPAGGFCEKEILAAIIAVEDILDMEGFSLREEIVEAGVERRHVFQLDDNKRAYVGDIWNETFGTLRDVIERLEQQHVSMLEAVYDGQSDAIAKALILIENHTYIRDLLGSIDADTREAMKDKYYGIEGSTNIKRAEAIFNYGPSDDYVGFDSAGRLDIDALGYLADRLIAAKIMDTQSAYEVIEYNGQLCEVYVDNGDINDFADEIKNGTLLDYEGDVVCPYDSYQELIDAQKEMILTDFNDIGLYEEDGSWGFYLTEKELVHIGLGNELERVKAEYAASVATREFYVNDTRVSWSEVWTSFGPQAQVCLDGVEIGVAKIGEKIVDGTFTGKPVYQFYPHNGAGISYEAECCADAVKAYFREYFVSLGKPIKIVSALEDMNEMVPSVAERLEKAIAKSEDIEILKMRSFLKKHDPRFATDEYLDGLTLDELRADFQECRKSLIDSRRDVGDDWVQRREILAAENLGFHG